MAAIAQAASTQADLRGWSTLPQDFQFMNVPFPQSGQLVLGFPGREDLTVQLPETKQPVIVYVRALNAVTPVSVELLMAK